MEEKLTNLLKKYIYDNSGEMIEDYDINLLEMGVIDSFDLINFISDFEIQYGVPMLEKCAKIEELCTINNIRELMKEQKD